MRIQLKHRNREIWLESDNSNFVVHEGYKNTFSEKLGKVVVSKIEPRYYHNLKHAMEQMLTIGIRKSDAKSLQALYDEIVELKRLIWDKVQV